MVVVPIPNPSADAAAEAGEPLRPATAQSKSSDWLCYSACGSLLAGGVLLLTGNRRAGLLAAVAGTTLAMLDQQETVRNWWNALPGLMDDANRMIGQVQNVVQNVDTQRERLRALVDK
ncbi:MAG TPA: hypothetical protein VLZ50_05800 [Terracidiphilus sp.]|nr:hypothetical protein [Terracidiphilus sp.]